MLAALDLAGTKTDTIKKRRTACLLTIELGVTLRATALP